VKGGGGGHSGEKSSQPVGPGPSYVLPPGGEGGERTAPLVAKWSKNRPFRRWVLNLDPGRRGQGEEEVRRR
jgi:hypothetical protein